MKIAFILVLAFIIFISNTSLVMANSLVVVDKNGDIVWNVLAEESSLVEIPKSSYLEVKKVANSPASGEEKITIQEEGGKVSMLIGEENSGKRLDVTDWSENLVEIEERAQVQKLAIRKGTESFVLENKGISAKTNYPLNVNPKNASISVTTPSGDRLLSILPNDAYQGLLKAKVISRLKESLSLVEENQSLLYKVKGEKSINFFNIYEYRFDVSASLSASTGEILKVEAPVWQKALSFILT